MTFLIPGSVQIYAGGRGLGRFARRVWGVLVLLAIVAAGLFFFARGALVAVAGTGWVLTTTKYLVWGLGFGWAILFLDATRLAYRRTMSSGSRLAMTIVTLLLVASLALASFVVGNGFGAAGKLFGQVFRGGGDSRAEGGRLNVLLLGSDAGKGRIGVRPDSITVASIDADTGRTVLFSLPRNMEDVPFPESSPLHELYPDGYGCESHECMLNAIYQLGVEHSDLFPEDVDPGLTAVRDAVSEILGLKINYYGLIDMQGFRSLIDAVGGIRLDIAKRVPIGGGSTRVSGYIEPGKNVKLDGYHALWFARSRHGSSDYERMMRQKCVMSAMLKQLDPVTVATKFNALADAGGEIAQTDVGSRDLNRLLKLAKDAKSLPIKSVSFSPEVPCQRPFPHRSGSMKKSPEPVRRRPPRANRLPRHNLVRKRPKRGILHPRPTTWPKCAASRERSPNEPNNAADQRDHAGSKRRNPPARRDRRNCQSGLSGPDRDYSRDRAE
ncbi:MAG: transcriptional regulator [Propionibacteriales bacterium]|nr:MAG: transcriptional regulator [Propionibacteriales bacterium]